MLLSRGAVWLAELLDIGRKPALVVSRLAVSTRLNPVVARITSVERDRALPTAVALGAGEVDGLAHPSWILCHDLATLADGALVEHLDTLSDERIVEVERCLAYVLGLENVA